jgi:hypothetical protein
VNSGQFIQWHDLFVLVDDGSVPTTRYDAIEAAMREQAKAYPQGIVCLVILPPDTRPPSDTVKRAVRDLLTRMVSSLSCLAYLVEGTGFKGVAARASLVGMKIFAARPYPIYVETSMREMLSKVLPHLAVGQTAAKDVTVPMNVISDARMAWIAPPPQPSRATGVTPK